MAPKRAMTDGNRVKTMDEVARIGDVVDLCNEIMTRHIHARHISPVRKWWWRVTGRYAAIERPVAEPEGQKPTARIDAGGKVIEERAD